MLTFKLKYYDSGIKIGPLTYITPEMVADAFKRAVANQNSLSCVQILDLFDRGSLKDIVERRYPLAEKLLSKIEPKDLLEAVEFILRQEPDFVYAITRVKILPRFKETFSKELLEEIDLKIKSLPKTATEYIQGARLQSYERLPGLTVNYHEKDGITVGNNPWSPAPAELKQDWDRTRNEIGRSVLWPILINHFKTVANDNTIPDWQRNLAKEEYLKLGYRDLEAV